MSVPQPQVIREPEIESLVHSVHCKAQYLGRLMLDGGMSPEQVSGMSVLFSAGEGLESTYDNTVIRGHYDHEQRQIVLNLGAFVDMSAAQQHLADKSPAYRRRHVAVLAQVRNHVLSETALHELRHAIDWHLMDETARDSEWRGFFSRTIARRNTKSELLGMGAAVSIGGLVGEMVGITNNPALLQGSVEGTMGGGLLCAAAAIYYSRKASNSHRTYADYLSRPWEMRAREYSRAQMQALSAAKQRLPVRADFKAIRALGSFG